MRMQQLQQRVCAALVLAVHDTDAELLPRVVQLLASRRVALSLYGMVVMHNPTQSLYELCRHMFCLLVGGALEEFMFGLRPTIPLPHALQA